MIQGQDGPRSVLVVGGAGAFGSRLVAGLVATTGLSVVVAGRDLPRAQAIVSSHPKGRVRAVRFDAREVGPDALRATGCGIVVDAAGPFQDSRPHLAHAAGAAGLHYVDLCDARDFVSRFKPALDAETRAAGVVALTGASTTPALSNAVLDDLARDWLRVDCARIAVVPGNRAPRGLSVMQAILSYVGQPIRVVRDGRWDLRAGWGLLVRETLPGLGRRWVSLCDTPDLDIMPARFPTIRAAVFRAGLELPVLHLGLWLASLPVRWRLLPSLTPFAGVFLTMASWLDRFGSDRGGMSVEVLGRNGEDRPTRAVWSLVAEAGDGPFIPTLAALAILRRLTDPRAAPIEPGARPCVGILSLAAIEAEMARHRIRTQVVVTHPEPLFCQALGSTFETMPSAIQALHDGSGGVCFAGQAAVERGREFFAGLVANLFRLPKPMTHGSVRVAIMPEHDDAGSSERWIRDFAGRRFESRMSLAPDGAGKGLMRERFGPFTMDLVVTAHAEGLDMSVSGWRLGSLVLPRFLRPTTLASERVDECGRFRFDVSLFLPFVGLLVRYRGWLVPDTDMPAEGERR